MRKEVNISSYVAKWVVETCKLSVRLLGSHKDEIRNHSFFFEYFFMRTYKKLAQSDIGMSFFKIRVVNHVVSPYNFWKSFALQFFKKLIPDWASFLWEPIKKIFKKNKRFKLSLRDSMWAQRKALCEIYTPKSMRTLKACFWTRRSLRKLRIFTFETWPLLSHDTYENLLMALKNHHVVLQKLLLSHIHTGPRLSVWGHYVNVLALESP